MDNEIFNFDVPDDIRYDRAALYLEGGVVEKAVVRKLLLDKYYPISCEALEYIIENRTMTDFRTEILKIIDSDADVHTRGRALAACSLSGIEVSSEQEFYISEDYIYSAWLDIYRYLKFKEEIYIYRIFLLKNSRNIREKELAANIISMFYGMIDGNHLSKADEITRSLK